MSRQPQRDVTTCTVILENYSSGISSQSGPSIAITMTRQLQLLRYGKRFCAEDRRLSIKG